MDIDSTTQIGADGIRYTAGQQPTDPEPYRRNPSQKLALPNLDANPTGPNVVGEVAVVDGKAVICTVAGSPGTWTVIGTQT